MAIAPEQIEKNNVRGDEVAVQNANGDTFMVRRFRRVRGDYFTVRCMKSGVVAQFDRFEDAQRRMSMPA